MTEFNNVRDSDPAVIPVTDMSDLHIAHEGYQSLPGYHLDHLDAPTPQATISDFRYFAGGMEDETLQQIPFTLSRPTTESASRRESFDSLQTLEDASSIHSAGNNDSLGKPPEPRKRPAWLAYMGGLKWKVEVLSCFIAFTQLACVIVILSVHSGRPRPQWPWKITINALI